MVVVESYRGIEGALDKETCVSDVASLNGETTILAVIFGRLFFFLSFFLRGLDGTSFASAKAINI